MDRIIHAAEHGALECGHQLCDAHVRPKIDVTEAGDGAQGPVNQALPINRARSVVSRAVDRVPVTRGIPKEVQIFWSEADNNLRSGHGSVTHRSERRAVDSISGHLQPFLEIGVDLLEGIQAGQSVVSY